MKAIRVNAWGTPVQIEDIPQPIPGNDEVLVRVYAASINPFDTAVLAGYLAFMATPPLTLGTDFAGDVVAVGADITHVQPGDAVYGLVVLRSGTFAEYTTVKAHEVSLKPTSLDYIHAAALPLPSMAAWQSLFDLAQLQDGERVLIHGVAGNVGGLAAQLAKEKGAYVYGTDIPEKATHSQRLGVDRFINTQKERFEDIVEDVDIVLDYVGGEYLERSYTVLKPGGRYVNSLVMETPQEEAQRRGIRSMGLGSQPRADLLAAVAERIDAGKLNVFVNRTFPLDAVEAAMEHRLKTTEPGKVVLTIGS
jgi:NADPH:quinone reductase-like Zn-dependent oxidoreductase